MQLLITTLLACASFFQLAAFAPAPPSEPILLPDPNAPVAVRQLGVVTSLLQVTQATTYGETQPTAGAQYPGSSSGNGTGNSNGGIQAGNNGSNDTQNNGPSNNSDNNSNNPHCALNDFDANLCPEVNNDGNNSGNINGNNSSVNVDPTINA